MTDIIETSLESSEDILTVPVSPYLKQRGYVTGIVKYEFKRSPHLNCRRSPWALKIKNKTITSYGKKVLEEASLLRKMSHPYIVFRTLSTTPECLEMEEYSVPLTDLIEKRSEEIQVAFPAYKIIKLAFHICKALDYLHVRMLMLHGDVKSHNILVRNDFEVCKLCDIGVNLPLTRKGELDIMKADEKTEYVGTLCWSAPEILQASPRISTKADIFSYGLVIWEMIALDIPHATEIIVDDDDFDKNVNNSFKENPELFGTRPPLPCNAIGGNIENYNYVLELFYCCTEKDPNRRPTAHHLSLAIFEILNAM